jgi:hypothetical protein
MIGAVTAAQLRLTAATTWITTPRAISDEILTDHRLRSWQNLGDGKDSGKKHTDCSRVLVASRRGWLLAAIGVSRNYT